MKQTSMLVAVLILIGIGLVAQDREPPQPGRRQRQDQGQRQQGGMGRNFQMPGMVARDAGADMLEPFVDRILERLDAGTLPEDLKLLAEELRLVRLKLRATEGQLQDIETSLLENANLVALYQVYQAAAKTYAQAVGGNEKIRVAKTRLAEIERGRGEMMSGVRGGGDENARRETFQKMREQMDEQRQLNEEIAAETKQNEAISKAAQAKAEAAAAAMMKYQELLAQNPRAKALKDEQAFLRQAQQALFETARAALGNEFGGGAFGGERRSGNPGGGPGMPQPPADGLDAF
jgi:hypothetical protein